jgi:hypothetical protein
MHSHVDDVFVESSDGTQVDREQCRRNLMNIHGLLVHRRDGRRADLR